MEIPAGLTELLQGFTVDKARHQPADLLEFALPHFTRLQQQKEGKGTLSFGHEGGTLGGRHRRGGGTPSKGVTSRSSQEAGKFSFLLARRILPNSSYLVFRKSEFRCHQCRFLRLGALGIRWGRELKTVVEREEG